jgi:hypothetical protein
MLVHLRTRAVEERAQSKVPSLESLTMSALAISMGSPRRWQLALRVVRTGRFLPRRSRVYRFIPGPLRAWTKYRDLPAPAKTGFIDEGSNK